jgi:mannose-6-phosphate isomerase-like protein (cupin superfamily)
MPEMNGPQGHGAAGVVTISHRGQTMAIVLPARHRAEGIAFYTPEQFSQQLGYMNRPQGYVIQPHVHNPVRRQVLHTREVLVIRSGRVRVDLYDDERTYLHSRILEAGDVILLAAGGHGFEMLEPSEIIEVKQGPYAGDGDKCGFEGIAADQVRIEA